jgi:hypothetical protein
VAAENVAPNDVDSTAVNGLHDPIARVMLPPGAGCPRGVDLCLSQDEIYDFLSKIDAIQRQVDSMFEASPTPQQQQHVDPQ